MFEVSTFEVSDSTLRLFIDVFINVLVIVLSF
jgi:hypothetical protein